MSEDEIRAGVCTRTLRLAFGVETLPALEMALASEEGAEGGRWLA